MLKNKVRDFRHHGNDEYMDYKRMVKASENLRLHGKPAVHVNDMCPIYSMLPVYGCLSVNNGTCACKLGN
jgi:hypothetical protein